VHGDVVAGAVDGEGATFAIQDCAAGGGEIGGPVESGLGLVQMLVVLGDGEAGELGREHERHGEAGDAEEKEPAVEVAPDGRLSEGDDGGGAGQGRCKPVQRMA
jgi:hypothetical protein